jgi:hypothetical protein
VRNGCYQAVAGLAGNGSWMGVQATGRKSDSVAGNRYRESPATELREPHNPLQINRKLLLTSSATDISHIARNLLKLLTFIPSCPLPRPIEREGFRKTPFLYLMGGWLRKLQPLKGSKNDGAPQHYAFHARQHRRAKLRQDRPPRLCLLAGERRRMPQRSDRAASPANRLELVRDYASGLAAARSAPLRSCPVLGADSAFSNCPTRLVLDLSCYGFPAANEVRAVAPARDRLMQGA